MPHLTWSHHTGRGRCLGAHGALLVCVCVMIYPGSSGEEFPSETWLRVLPHGLNHTVTLGEGVDDVGGSGGCPLHQGLGFRLGLGLGLGASTSSPSSSSSFPDSGLRRYLQVQGLST